MQQEQWNQDFALSLAVYMNGQGIRSVGSKGEKILDDSFYILFNASHVPIDFKLPSVEFGNSWKIILDTSEDHIFEQRASFHPGELVKVEGRSIVLLNHPLKETSDNYNEQ